MSKITIEHDGNGELGACADCGSTTRTVWGHAYQDDACVAGYCARSTEGHPERPIQMLLGVGRWSDGADRSMRRRIGIECRIGEDRPVFMVIDANTLAWPDAEILGKAMTRSEVLADPVHELALQILDRVVVDDLRVRIFLTLTEDHGS